MSVASLRDVAQVAGVSVTTVSRFLNGTLDLPERTRTAVEAAILQLNYQPNPHARRLSRGRSDTIGLVIPDIATPFFATLVAAVEAEADRRRLGLTLHATLNRRERELSYLQAVRRNQVDGLIFVTNHPDDGTLAAAINASGQVVVLDEDVAGTSVPKLFCDNEQGGYLAGRHLAEAGHRRVLFIGGVDAMLSGARRFNGFRRAMTEVWGADARIERYEGEYSTEFGQSAAKRMLESRLDVTAVFATSDEITIGALEVLNAAGIRVPQDLSLVGFDDVGPLHLFAPAVTAVRQPVRDLGIRALSLLLDTDWTDPTKLPPEEIMPVTLITRNSVAPVIRS
ncbi:MAG: LacI family DNA-binding transcriptional regulator [Tabrizicola sp.]|jgi:LacI family transcriptional regulator|uniref:LacI family DNA-binding transcriptional regulator n=1 Tax=Tabrizicola sp. TaxID=2005166 RepID=UPI003BAEF056|nr:LacI family DNA-binding transcriptional regulator [Tabrizicola sp.]